MEKKFCTFKACEFSKDFMIAVEALIKAPSYQKILNRCFASTFSEVYSELSQKSKIELFAEIFNCFNPFLPNVPFSSR